ncbi:S-protein homolog 1-like [Gossypium arboreum]|uniref:S-protein homolog n=1 Tax=Gossypium arboreum TaxID=29729 RepID=A0ABR0P558_GOSAR|nr:S-protein homolog 1-like [Gossypium arboreum]KAK5813438.1 hypothetical protein PVK06_028888 [Gossypium arboreum]
MNSFCKNIMFFIFIHAIAIIPLIASSSSEPDQGHHDDNNMRFLWFDKWQVHVVNDLSNKKTLLVHCKSKDDDLGIHNIAAGTEYNWKFRPRVFGNTLFWCHLAYDNLHAAFDVYWENEALYYKCDYNDCFWIARDDGIYLKDIRNNRVEYRHSWKLG